MARKIKMPHQVGDYIEWDAAEDGRKIVNDDRDIPKAAILDRPGAAIVVSGIVTQVFEDQLLVAMIGDDDPAREWIVPRRSLLRRISRNHLRFETFNGANLADVRGIAP